MKPYEQRLWSEYTQLVDRLTKLTATLENWACLDFVPSCTREQLSLQAAAMTLYLHALEDRDDFKGINEKAAA